MTAAAQHLGLPVWTIDLPPPVDRRPEIQATASTLPPPGVPLVLHVNAPLLPLALLRLPASVTRHRPIIGYWAWEMPEVPPEWRPALACVDQVWVPSRFTAAALEPLLPGRIKVVPPPLSIVPPVASNAGRDMRASDERPCLAMGPTRCWPPLRHLPGGCAARRPGITVTLSLCQDAEILAGPRPPVCEMPVRTYRGFTTLLLRLATAPLALPFLIGRLRGISPDLAICAMAGPLDLLMAVALRILGTRLVVVVHDADLHPGDGFSGQMHLQRLLCRLANGLAVLCGHVATRLRQQNLAGTPSRPLIPFRHPPFAFDMPAIERPAGPPRLLCFGRLLPYKGLDLLAEALATLPPQSQLQVRVVGCGPETPALAALRECRDVTVENRWVPEIEIGSLLTWSDALILPYREASQSGVAAP